MPFLLLLELIFHSGTAANAFGAVRPMGPVMTAAVVDRVKRSVTFRPQMERLGRSDVIVYVRAGSCPDDQSIACLSILNGRGAKRFLLVTLVVKAHGESTLLMIFTNHLVAHIGHELQHAIEVAEDPATSSK